MIALTFVFAQPEISGKQKQRPPFNVNTLLCRERSGMGDWKGVTAELFRGTWSLRCQQAEAQSEQHISCQQSTFQLRKKEVKSKEETSSEQQTL